MSESQEITILPDNNDNNRAGDHSYSGGASVATQPFALTPKTYYRIFLHHWYRKYWWIILLNPLLFLLLCGLTTLFFFYGKTDAFYFSLKIIACYVLFILFYHGSVHWRFRRAAYHPANKPIMRRHTYTLKKENFTVCEISDDDQENIVVRKTTDLFQVVVCQQYYLLFLTPYFFCYLPKDAFRQESDRELFEREILPEYPLVKSNTGKGLFYCFLLFILCVILGVTGGILLSF
ncbi:MAG: hypothetical protein LBT05_10060 [Planctomycetaceae bacterium]|jgi:hypothetical protein|nr:hypothetical protein [Planctomycetaceae bacterium]